MEETTGDDGARAMLADLLRRAVIAGASDLHLMSGERPHVRLMGALEALQAPPTTASRVERMLEAMRPPHLQADAQELDFSHEHAGRRYRVSAFQERRGWALALRLLEGRAPTLEALGLPRDLLRAVHAPSGLVLFAGHAGAGKTTTMAAALQVYCDRRPARVITIEDPIEYRLEPGLAYVEQREVGRHCPTFAAGLEEATLAQPDAIAVGELRDLETIRLGLSAAETGVLVFATVHAYDATRAVGRLVDAFPPEDRPAARAALAANLRMIVAQTLLPRRDGKGRAPAAEVVHGCASLSTIIREGKEHELATVIEGSASRGMRSLDDALAELVRQGVVDRAEALARAVNPDSLLRRLA